MTAWCRSAGPEWSVVATEDDEFRLLFRGGRVLYCYPMGDAVTAWVDMSEPEDVPHLLTVGQSKFGFEGDPRGIRLRRCESRRAAGVVPCHRADATVVCGGRAAGDVRSVSELLADGV